MGNHKHQKRRRRRFFWRLRQCIFLVICIVLLVNAGNLFIRLLPNDRLESLEAKKQVMLHTSQYPQSLVDLLNKNPETADFVADYPKYANKHGKINIKTDYQKGKIPYFLQWDKRWGYEDYNGDYFALTGCGPTSLSMVIVGLTGNLRANPLAVGTYSEKNGYAEIGHGTRWAFMTEAAGHYSLAAKELSLSESVMKAELEMSHPIIAIMGPGDFTDSGHFIVIYDMDTDGNFLVHDANSPKNSKRSWEYDTLAGQIKNLWSYQKLQ